MNQTANSSAFLDRLNKVVKTLFAAFGASFVVFFTLASFHTDWLNIQNVNDQMELNDLLGWSYIIGGFLFGLHYLGKKDWTRIFTILLTILLLGIFLASTGPHR
ncbi:MAG: hypothetical protein BroJett018_24330 [Chloroflexota bacterium]|nr:MAG: hypothetical protein BroJett018_24330 [Chloroflexota bacterium]